MSVADIGKPRYTECEHQVEGGCWIYHRRPPSCRSFRCFWLGDRAASESQRPNTLGVILEEQDTTVGPAIVVRECYEGAWDHPDAQAYVDHVLERTGKFAFVVMMDESRKAVVTRATLHLVPQIQKVAARSKSGTIPIIVREIGEAKPRQKTAEERAKEKARQKRKLAKQSRRKNRR